jgi:hypothetical protein
MAQKQKRLTDKQKRALEMLTSGVGYTYKQIGEEIQVDQKTLWNWRNSPDFSHFQDELKRLNDIRWQAAEDAAREGCIMLCREGNQKMIEFVLKNAGYNPTQKVEAEVSTNITINIGEEEELL